MRNFSNYAALGSVQDSSQQLKALAQAIETDFSLPAVFNDLGGHSSTSTVNGIKIIGAKDGNISVPSVERVKGYLATKWAVPGDNPNLVDPANRVVQFFHTNMPDMDLGYTAIYDFVDMRTANMDSFDILDANMGISFSQKKAGEEVKIRRVVNDSKMTVPMVTFSDGVGILDDWLRYQKWWQISDTVAEFNAKAWDQKATWHYQLITSLSNAINVPFNVDDTTTLNQAAAGILRKVRAKGYGAGANAGFVILCAPENVGRITRMLSAANGSLIVAYNPNVEPVNVRISTVVASVSVPANTGGYYLVLPGRKLKRADWKDLTIESARNIYVRGSDYVGTFQTNVAIGDQDQVARILFQ